MLSHSIISNSLWLHQVPLCMGILQARILEWVACSPPRHFPNPGIEPWSPAVQADALPAEPLRGPWVLEWVAYSFSRGSLWPRSRTEVPCIVGEFFTSWATRENPGTPLWTLVSPHILRYFYCDDMWSYFICVILGRSPLERTLFALLGTKCTNNQEMF